MATNNSDPAGGKAGAAGADGAGGDGSNGKTFTNEEVEEIVNKRLANTKAEQAATRRELSAAQSKLAELEKKIGQGTSTQPATKQDEIAELRALIKSLQDDNAKTKAEAEAAKLDTVKVRLAKKAGLPQWFDPTLIRGKDPDEIQANIDQIVADMKASDDQDGGRKKGFGGKIPRSAPTKPATSSEFMNGWMLRQVNRGTIRAE